jgi:adenylate cyclase
VRQQMMKFNSSLQHWLSWLDGRLSRPEDSGELRLGKTILALLALIGIVVVGPIWGGTYLWLGYPLAGSIPITFALLTAAGLVHLLRTRRIVVLRSTMLILVLLAPVALHWSLGGFYASSAVIIWSLFSPIGALMFTGRRQAMPWFLILLSLLAISSLFDARLAQNAAALPAAVQITFFLLNLGSVSSILFLILLYFVRERDRAHQRSEELLLNVLPQVIADRLKRDSGTIADYYPQASVLFADVVGFTPLSAQMAPEEMVLLLNEIFSHFDTLAEKYGLEKIRTIGDNYMVAAGAPSPRPDHALVMAAFALEMKSYITTRPAHNGQRISFRMGINSGPMVGGVIGRQKFHFDIWGDTVNIASRMESQGVADEIQVTSDTYHLIKESFHCRPRGTIEIKGRGQMNTWFLEKAREVQPPKD